MWKEQQRDGICSTWWHHCSQCIFRLTRMHTAGLSCTLQFFFHWIYNGTSDSGKERIDTDHCSFGGATGAGLQLGVWCDRAAWQDMMERSPLACCRHAGTWWAVWHLWSSLVHSISISTWPRYHLQASGPHHSKRPLSYLIWQNPHKLTQPSFIHHPAAAHNGHDAEMSTDGYTFSSI